MHHVHVLIGMLTILAVPIQVQAELIASGFYLESGTYENGGFHQSLGDYIFDDADYSTQSINLDLPGLINKAFASYVFQDQGTTANIAANFSFLVDGKPGNLSYDDEGYATLLIEFTPNEDMSYSITHSWDTVSNNVDRQYNDPYRKVEIYEQDTNTDKYLFEQGRNPYLGFPGYGNPINYLVGSSEGILQAGRVYDLTATFDLHAFENLGDLEATGSLNLSMQNVSAVPEPSSLLPFGMLTCGGLMLRRKRQFAIDVQ